MPEVSYGARPILMFKGQRLPMQLEASVVRTVVHTDLVGPDACTITLSDPGRNALSTAGVEFLAEVEVRAAPTGTTSEEVLFAGTVYSLGFEYDDAGAVAVIGAMDHSYALYAGRHTTTYRDVTDADLAQQLAKEAGLTCSAESTPVVHPHVAQFNETHWELLTRRAREIGYEVRVVGKELRFAKSAKASGGPQPGGFAAPDRLALTPGGNLEAFTARITVAQQVSEVEVRGWDPQEKQALVSTAPAETRAMALTDTPADLASKNGSPRSTLVDLPLATTAECDAAAAAEAERLASTFAHAEGIAKGDPRIVAGSPVSIGTSGRFDGQYTVTEARHVFGTQGYRTEFTVSGAHDRSLLGVLDPSGAATRQTIGGVVIGLVTNVTDPDDRSRVKLKFPWLSDDFESDWARVLQLGAGKERGLVLMPEVNDEVLVAFEQGDTRRPVVLGGLFNGVDVPPYPSAGVESGSGVVDVRGLRTRKGHEIVLHDTDGGERIEVQTKDGKVSILLDHDGGKLVITTDSDVEVKAGGDVKVEAKGMASVEAQRDVTLKAGGSMKLEANGEVSVKGAVIKLN